MASLTVLLAGFGAVAVLLGLSAFFSSSEIAVFSLSPDWVGEQDTGDSRAAALKDLYEDPHRLLVTLLVGNNVVNIAISSVVTALVTSFLSPGPAVVVATLSTSFVVLIFGEIVPKAYGLGNAETWSLTVAPPIRNVERVLSPLISLLDALTGRMNAFISGEPGIEKPYMD